jgi:uncharacterized protein YgiM (DUF1202 family)
MTLLALLLTVTAASALQATDTPDGTPESICPNAPRNRLIVRERARVSADDPRPVNLRAGPGTTFEVIEQVTTGTIFYVLEGPECSARYSWYRIEVGGEEGWLAEGDSTNYYVELYLPG